MTNHRTALGWVRLVGLIGILASGAPLIAAVSTVSDDFNNDASGNRDNGDLLNGVISRIGSVLWEANNVKFKQPSGTVTNTTSSGVRGFVPVPAGLPVGTTYSVKVDVKFQQQAGLDSPVRYVQLGFLKTGVTNNAFTTVGSHSLYLRCIRTKPGNSSTRTSCWRIRRTPTQNPSA